MEAAEMRAGTPTDIRLTLRGRGYHPVPTAGKRVKMDSWTQRCLDASIDDIRRWAIEERSCKNTGILCGTLIGVDIDVLDQVLSEAIERRAQEILGATPLRRVGRAPKALLAYRIARPIKKMKTDGVLFTDDPSEKPTQIEILAEGQQFVGFGVHPETRQPYRWDDASPLTVDFVDLPEVTEDALTEFLVEAETILRAAGGTTDKERRSARVKDEREHKSREAKGRKAAGFGASEKPTHEKIAEALDHIPNDLDYDEWVRIGFALYDGLGEGGRSLWESWSANSPKNDPTLTEKKWPSFANNGRVGVGTLFWLAIQNGWKPKKDRAERRASADPEAAPQDDDSRPIVRFILGKVPEAVDRMETLLLDAGVQIYARAGALVRPVIDTVPAAKCRVTTVARMSPFSTVSLADQTARVMRVLKFDCRSQDWLDINPPHEMTKTLLERDGHWKCPQVAGIITTPTLRPDGSLLKTPGYDPATRLYLAHDPDFRMPELHERPDQGEARAALAFIEELLVGFPFVSPVDKAVALSGILTALVRGVIQTAPLHAIRASTPGSGKSHYVDLASVIASGRRCPVIANGKTEEETEKRLGALLRDAVPVISIDNVNGELGGDMLCQLTERPMVRVRILGKSEAPELECRSTVFATGNGLVLLGDMTRRALVCSLDAEMDRPELRTFDFDPIARVLADRGTYVAAALTVIRAYQLAGFPPVCGPIGSYEEWSAMVRAPLIWLGHADPVASMETAREEDPELSAIRELFGHWREHLNLAEGYTTNSITSAACAKAPTVAGDFSQQQFLRPDFRDLLLREVGDHGAVNSRRLGKWLSRIKGRVVAGHRIEMRENSSHGNRYSLVQVGAAASGYSEPMF